MKDCLKVFNLDSNECYVRDDTHVLNKVTFTLDSHDSLGVISLDTNETKILLEVLANLRPYYDGYVNYLNRGMYRKKRINVEHIFYIDNSHSLIDDMTVLEYLMFLTGKFKTPPIKRQKAIFNMLIDMGLDYVSLSKIGYLTSAEKMLICLFGTIFAGSEFIIANLNSYKFSDKEIDILKKIITRLQNEKTLILSTTQAKLIGICCNKILFVNKGIMKYFGTVLEMQLENDNVMYILKDKNLNLLYEKMVLAFPYLEIRREHNMVLVCSKDGRFIDNARFYQDLADNKIFPAEVKINLGRVSNAIEELLRSDDIQE